ncbi:NHLP bacteriocin system secretion protein [Legionella sp.]|uniref:NHLP bacteriocin system secretion protein n=1 Tax=Legionella sp. TaxID=459 RepID=UPI00321FE62C
MKDSDLYRKQALDSAQERDEFQHAIRIITPKAWIYLIVFLIIFVGCLLWLILGKISSIVEGQGIILAKNAAIINVMSPISGGYVSAVLVNPGQEVKKGQILATLTNPNMAAEAKELRKYIEQEKAKLNNLSATAQKEIAIRLKHIEESMNYAKTINANLKEKKEHLESLLKIQETAFKKGILSRLELNDMQVAYYDAKEQISKNQNTLVELNQNRNDYIESWNTKLREQQEKVAQSEFNLRKLLENLNLTENVYSPADGVIATNYVKKGDFLTEKQTLTNIITHSNDLEVVAFFNANEGKKIKIGMPAKVFPKHFNTLEFGGVVGRVTYVSELPINPPSIESTVENQKLVDKFIQQGPVFKVKIALIHSSNTPSGYLWTTSKGPHERLSIGSIASVGITVKKQHPLAIIIPIVESAKNWMIGEND